MPETKSSTFKDSLQGKDLRKALEGLLDGLAHGLLAEVDRRSAGELTEQELLVRIRNVLSLVAPGAVDVHPPPAAPVQPPPGPETGIDLDFTGLPGLGGEGPAEPGPAPEPEPKPIPEIEPIPELKLEPAQESGDVAILDDFSEEPPSFGTLDFDVPTTDVPATDAPKAADPETGIQIIETPKPSSQKTAFEKASPPNSSQPGSTPPETGPARDFAPPSDEYFPELEFHAPDTGISHAPGPEARPAQPVTPESTPPEDTADKTEPPPEPSPSSPRTAPGQARPAKASAPEKTNKVVPIRPAPAAAAASTAPGTPEKSKPRTPGNNGSAATATDLIPRPESHPQKDKPAKDPARRRRPWDPPEGRSPAPGGHPVRQAGGGVRASGRLGFDEVDADAANAIRGALHVPGQGNGFASAARPGAGDDYAFAQRMAKDLDRQAKTRKDPQKAFVLSLAFAGLGDFYGGFPGVGLLFYTPYFALLMLLIINSDWRLLLAMGPLALVSACMSYLNVTSHNRRVERIKSQVGHAEKTRETHFSMKGL